MERSGGQDFKNSDNGFISVARPDQDFVSSSMPSLPFPRKDISFTTPLIYRTSPKSPFYDANTKHEDLISNVIRTCASFHTDDMDKFTSDGYVGTDTITLADNGITGETNLEHMMSGCGTQNTDKGTKFPGVIGLANHTSSLIGQLEYPQFSYYVSTSSNGTYGEIDFGLLATTPGDTTPLVPNDYGLLRLKVIMVSGQDIYILQLFGSLLNTGRYL
ncbi:hypothetical protein RJ639_004556 [Escallonia herrerae]|uniref:Xylanase inhibitor N-terminal domain-containing protein n=1 Tax=Escallonia herrerae TaxID=1293975 RepID=A0AA89AUY4_9ASTE|nr:hypothetical protein RJ639_004556 [Escallonia herrerae]